MPSSPGVYWFLDKNNHVIYVGKAKNLSNRLQSYASSHVSAKVSQLVRVATQVKYQVLDSELEALFIEAQLIHLHQPQYNSLLKDDKSPLYIIITKEQFPRVLTVRKNEITSHQYIVKKAFGPFSSSTQVKEVIKLVRRLFPFCNQTRSETKNKACFYFHLGLCPGVCTHTISSTEYIQNIRHLELFLSGKFKSVISEMKKIINQLSTEMRFEEANQYKVKIDAIVYVVSHYHTKKLDEPLPQLTGNQNNFMNLELLRFLQNKGVSLPKINRIEAYDVANIQGKSPAVSMVVSIDGELKPSEYRYFSIKTLNTPHDVGMLKEAYTRRQNHPEWGIPDLILVDGGKGQINAIRKCIIWKIPIIGIAKHPDRLIIPNIDNQEYSSYMLNPNQPAHQLIIILRDEAHRFARKLFMKRYDKALLNK